MEENSTERFLRLLQEQNVAIAAAEAQKEKAAETDPIRVQRQQERHEKYGTLRAREKPGKRPHRVQNVLPHVDLS